MTPHPDARIHLSVVLPCYKPKPGWHLAVADQYQQLKSSLPGTAIEFIVVNDGSPDNLTVAAKRWLRRRCSNITLITYDTNQGKGFAVRRGVQAARAPNVIYTDIDFPYTIADICSMYQLLSEGRADVIMGVRELSYTQQLSWLRRAASNSCNFLNVMLLNLPYRDVQSGIKGMNITGRQLLLKTSINRFLFDTEFIWLANSYDNVNIRALPVTLREGISFTSMAASVYLKETKNFLKIFYLDKLLLLRRIDHAFQRLIPRTA